MSKFLGLAQDRWMTCGIHTSGSEQRRRINLPFDGLTTVAASLNKEKLRFASLLRIISHAGSGSRNVFSEASLTAKDVVSLNLNCAFRYPPRVRRTWTQG
jgi:hypothetical protein